MNTRFPVLRLALIGLGLAVVSCGGEAETRLTEADLIERARRIHEQVITLDTHNDIDVSNFTVERNYTMDLPTQVNIPKMEQGGLDVSWMIVYVRQGELTEDGYVRARQTAMAKFEAIHRLAEEIAPDRVGIAYTSDDVRRIVASGKKAVMIGVENAYSIGLDLSNIREFHELGARYMSLAHNGHSQFSDSNTGERDGVWLHHGLSDLGRQAVAEMNRLGIMIDLSHPSKAANLETLALSRAPVIASHSAARAVNDVSRNLSDEELLALKENGGVVQTVAFRSYINSAKHAAHREAMDSLTRVLAAETAFELLSRREISSLSEDERAAYRAGMDRLRELGAPRIEQVNQTTPPVDVADFVDHIDYLVDLIGIDHVGLSSDFDGGGGVDGWNDASETFNVTLELVRRGYPEEEIAKLWSGNLLRVLDEVQRIATAIRAGA